MSLPFNHLCGECGDKSVCHNYIHRNKEVSVEEATASTKCDNPAINSSVFLSYVSCNRIEEFLSNQKMTHHTVFIPNKR